MPVNQMICRFFIRRHRIINGKAPIYVRVTVNGKRCEISVKRRISVNNWNNGKGYAKGKSPEITALNSYLEQIRGQLTGHYQDLVISKQPVTVEAVKDKFLGIEKSGETIKSLIKYHNIRMDENFEELFYHKKVY